MLVLAQVCWWALLVGVRMVECEILVLEDETFIALDIELTLAEAGFQNISVHTRSDSALQWLAGTTPHAALLDVNLGQGETSVTVATRLKEVGVPFAFLTGYSDGVDALPADLSGARRMTKPFESDALVGAVTAMIAQAQACPSLAD